MLDNKTTEATPQPDIATPELSYFDERMNLLGITPEINTIDVWKYDADKKETVLKPLPVFEDSKKYEGIQINVFTLDRLSIQVEKDSDGRKDGTKMKTSFAITRLKKPRINAKTGNEQKYDIPRGAGTYPFFSPSLIKKFESKTHIETLIITEGYFKAFKGCMHGFDVVGLSSITHYKDKDTKGLHEDIIRLIKACTVKRVVILYDGDANYLSAKALDAGDDIHKRPNSFFSSASRIKYLLEDFDVTKIFAHISSDDIEGFPKGLDDLLVAMKGREQEVVDDFNTWSKPSKYFYKQDITFKMTPVYHYFHLGNVNSFVEHHATKHPGIKEKEFVFIGTRYKWNPEKNECKIVIPADAKRYFRVGDQYHEFVLIPDKYGKLDQTFHRRQKGTIMDDYGKDFCTHIPKYKAFCNLPDHVNYQQTPHNCFNMYAPFDHEPEEGECTNILVFLRHIFGSGEINFTHPKTKEKITYKELDLGLDYITLLYKQPTQILPILCLVSREQGTGKTTFATLLKQIFTANVAIVGNAELADNFNASWASKLIVICDEAKIDKQVVVEKVKSLSTASKIMMNAKGKDHVEIDFFGKFLFMTNNEENFIYASDDDVRYWVRKIPRIAPDLLNINMLSEMRDEIPAFLNYLLKRKMATTNEHRAWFHPDLIKTDALQKVVAFSRSTVEKELRQNIRDIFLDHGVDEFMMTRQAIQENLLNKKYEANYLERVLKEDLKVQVYHEFEYNGQSFMNYRDIELTFGNLFDSEKVTRIQKVKRHSYPKWEYRNDQRERVMVSDNGRPYVFKVDQFLLPEEIKHRKFDDENISNLKELQLKGSDQLQFAINGSKDTPF